MDFLTSEEPFDFESVLVSYAEDGVIYLNRDFKCYITNVDILLSALQLAKTLVCKRVAFRQCTCTTKHRLSFDSVLVKHFENKTLFQYLLHGDDMQLDNFKVDVMANFSAFDVHDVYTRSS